MTNPFQFKPHPTYGPGCLIDNDFILSQWCGHDEPLSELSDTNWNWHERAPDPLADLQARWDTLCSGNRQSLDWCRQERWHGSGEHLPYGLSFLAQMEWLKLRADENSPRFRIVAWYSKPLYRCERGGLGDAWHLPRDLLFDKIYRPDNYQAAMFVRFAESFEKWVADGCPME